MTSDKFSVKELFLEVDKAVKLVCFYFDQHLLLKKM